MFMAVNPIFFVIILPVDIYLIEAEWRIYASVH